MKDLATKEGHAKLELSMATIKQSIESELENLQHFSRNLNISLTNCQQSIRALQASGQTQQSKPITDVSVS